MYIKPQTTKPTKMVVNCLIFKYICMYICMHIEKYLWIYVHMNVHNLLMSLIKIKLLKEYKI